jgi:hypothetical protein
MTHACHEGTWHSIKRGGNGGTEGPMRGASRTAARGLEDDVPIMSEGFPPSSSYNNQTYETSHSTEHTGEYTTSAGTSSEGTEDSNPEGHPAVEDGFDFQYGEHPFNEFHASNSAGRPAGEQVPTVYFGTGHPRDRSPTRVFDPSGLVELLGFILQCLHVCKLQGMYRMANHAIDGYFRLCDWSPRQW